MECIQAMSSVQTAKFGAAVCTENLIRFDLVTESLNVGCDGRAVVLPFETIGLAVQID